MRRPHLALALMLLAAPAGAQLTTPQATAQFKQDIKTRTAQVKAALATVKSDALATIDTYEAAVAQNGWDPAAAGDFFGALDATVGAAAAAVHAAASDLADDASGLLTQITDAPDTVPTAFAAGGGSAFDAARVKLLQAGEKTLLAVFKRLDKTAALLDKTQGVRLVAVHRPLLPSLVDFAPTASGTLGLPTPFGLSADLALSFSRADTPADGVIGVGGEANFLGGSLVVVDDLDTQPESPTADNRWGHVFGLDTGKPEGNHLLQISPQGGGVTETLVIAVQ